MDAFPESPWSVLGLDGASATDRDIKRSYARLIKVHRPDAEPDEFQRIHQAYQLALIWRRHRDESIEDEEPNAGIDETENGNGNGTEIPGQTDPPEMLLDFVNGEKSSGKSSGNDVPPVFQTASEALEQSLEKGDFEAITKSMDLFRTAFREHPSLAHEWEKILMDLFPRDLTSLGLLLTPEEVRRLIEWDCEYLPQPVMMEWHRRRATAKLIELATTLLDRNADGALEDSEVLALCQARLALLTAFGNHRVAEKLANIVFPKLPPGRRDQIMGEIDHRLAMGKLFAVLPMPTRLFFEARLFPGEETVDWSSPESKRALNEVRARCPRDWPGFVVLRQHLPPQIFRWLMQMYPIGTTQETGLGMPSNDTSTGPKRAFSKTFIFILIWLALIMVRNVNSCSQQNPRPSKSTQSGLPSFDKVSGEGSTLAQDISSLDLLKLGDKGLAPAWDKSDVSKNAAPRFNSLNDNIQASLKSALDAASRKDVNWVAYGRSKPDMLKAVQGGFPCFRRGSVKHLALIASLLLNSNNDADIFKSSLDALLTDHSPSIAANVLITVRAQLAPVQERTDPALAEYRRAADALLDDHSNDLDASQKKALQDMAR